MFPAQTNGSPNRLIVAVGAAHVDRRAKAFAPYRPAASNPGRQIETLGGAMLNAMTAIRGLDQDIVFIGARGGDGDGDRVATELETLGIADVSTTWLDRRTPSYTAILDSDGDLVAGVADMELYDAISAKVLRRRHHREAIARADGLLLDANLPADVIDHLMRQTDRCPSGAIAVSPAKVGRLRNALSRLSMIFLSRSEAAALADVAPDAPPIELCARLHQLGVARAAITDGPHAVTIFDGGDVLVQQPPEVTVHDVTGAGDTLAGVAFAAFVCDGAPFVDAVRQGIVAAALRVSLERFPPADFTQILADGVSALAPVKLIKDRS